MNRVELISRVAGALGGSPFGATYFDDAERVLDAILPQVTTVEELEALPHTTFVQGADNSLWEKGKDDWLCAQGSDGWDRVPDELLKDHGPLTVVWTP